MNIPRPEYPRPQFQRDAWLNLNGEWTCRFDPGRSGFEQNWQSVHGFEQKIQVPFCPESKLSGIGHTDFIDMMWYHREIAVPAAWVDKRILLNFGGIDYECEVFLDGIAVGGHTGGSSPFGLDLTGCAIHGRNHHLVIKVRDNLRDGNQAFGKQSPWFKSQRCNYTRTTGIWQTVWMEAVDIGGLSKCRIVPDFDGGKLVFTPVFYCPVRANQLHIRISASGEEVAATIVGCANGVPVALAIPDPVAWEPGNPFLYEVVYEVRSEAGEVLDRVESYAGLRKIHIEGERMFLNNKPLFVRLVLDQGFYEDGLWTAPSDEALKHDIELSMEAGFNGARLHQKVFEERFHYWADRLGYLTWGEFSDWGIGFWKHFRETAPADYQLGFRNYLAEWTAVVERDWNHPSIIAWTPFNETNGYMDWAEHRRIIGDVYELTRTLDPTRPVNDTSGYVHVRTDIWSVHLYQQDTVELAKYLKPDDFPVFCTSPKERPAYRGQPYIVDEYGGVKYIPEDRQAFADNSWGYGQAPASQAEAFGRIRDLTAALVARPEVSGYCYTQLTDVEQEQNGIYNYDRSSKFDMAEIFKVFSAKPDWSHY